ncbi:MAG: hypothetical protein P8X81_10375 [Woeseiaceae bacterium]|jgi:hypothetical protein
MIIATSIRKSVAITLVGIAMAFATQAFAGLGPVVSQAYEIALTDFLPPATRNGSATFNRCETCEKESVRVTAETRYTVNGRAVRLEDFRKAVAGAHDRDQATVVVLHHLESDTIVSISVSL